MILGSFPSILSLDLGEYYGNGRNHFWTLMGLILDFDPGMAYPERLSRLALAGLALWDVIASCERVGSLDQDIREEEPTALGEYIRDRPTIERVALNGGKAAASFLSHIAPELRPAKAALPAIGEILTWLPPFAPGRRILVGRLPSTSPVPTRDFRCAADKLPSWSAFLGA